jgi:hypothetical protein
MPACGRVPARCTPQIHFGELKRPRPDKARTAVGWQVLLRAALVELARAQRGAAEAGGGPAVFPEAAVRGLWRHGYPFAPLLRLADVTGVVPSAAEPYFLDCQSASDAALTRRFTQLTVEADALV